MKCSYAVRQLVLCLTVGYALLIGASATAETTPSQALAQDGPPQEKVEAFWTQIYDDLGRNTGTTDAAGHSDKIEYGGGIGR